MINGVTQEIRKYMADSLPVHGNGGQIVVSRTSKLDAFGGRLLAQVLNRALEQIHGGNPLLPQAGVAFLEAGEGPQIIQDAPQPPNIPPRGGERFRLLWIEPGHSVFWEEV